MPYFNPGQTAIDELKMRIQTLESEYRHAKRHAKKLREDARQADSDAAEIHERIQQYAALIPTD